jgi:hypothetical protein
MVVKSAIINTINDHVQFPVVNFTTATKYVIVATLFSETIFQIITNTILIVNII